MAKNLTLYLPAQLQKIFVFVFVSFISAIGYSQSCASCTFTSTTGKENFNLASGNRLCIPKGVVFKGNVNGNNHSNTSICVADGGTINNASFNNFGGTLTNFGVVTMANGMNISVANQTIENYGRMTMGNVNFNAKGIFRNLMTGHLVFSQNLTLSNGSEVYNEDTVIVQGNFNGNSTNVLFENMGFAIINGSYASSGSTLNSGFLIATNEINNNNGGVMVNNCSLIMDGNFNNNGQMTNNGNLLLMQSGRFQNNGSSTFTNGVTGFVQGGDFTNNGTVLGRGHLRFTGVTRNNGGGRIGQNLALNFFDTGAPAGGLDFQNGVLDPAVSFTSVDAVNRNDLQSTCSSNMFAVFPVEFGEMEAFWQTGAAVVRWTTLSELHNRHFEIERSVDGSFFETVGQVASQGDHQTFASYTYFDHGVPASQERIYYRLRQVDIDGRSELSPTVELVRSRDAFLKISVSPNPAAEMVNLELSAPADRIEIVSIDGRILTTVEAPSYREVVSVKGFVPGLYFVRSVSGIHSSTAPLIIHN